MSKSRTFRIKDATGLVVVEVTGPNKQAESNIMHYALQYVQDGPITVEEFVKAGWRKFIEIEYHEDKAK